MDTQVEFEALRRAESSWWSITRRKLLRDAAAQAVRGKREARILDFGCTAQLEFADSPYVRVLNVHSSLPSLAFQQIEGGQNLVCTRSEELALASNSFDVVVAGDVLQSLPDDLIALRELRRVLKDGGSLCLTVPAYPWLWGEEDEARGHQRRYTSSELRRKLNNCGFEISRVSYLVAAGFLPSILERVGKNIFKKSIVLHRTSAETPAWANTGMILLLECERQLIRYINLPFGTRLVCWARKPAPVAERIIVPAWERRWARRPLPQGMG
jgi:SAM-dependent methyltransferase